MFLFTMLATVTRAVDFIFSCWAMLARKSVWSAGNFDRNDQVLFINSNVVLTGHKCDRLIVPSFVTFDWFSLG